MKYYRFKTFRTSYYFPDTNTESNFLYGVYHPYGSLLVKLYWKLFTFCKWIRSFSIVDENKLDFPYQTIKRFCPKDALMSFNLGTPGDEQKISMLGYLPKENTSFFAKYSTKDKAKELSRNEMWVLKELEGKGLAPKLLTAEDNGNEVFFMTSRICGKAYASFELTDQIVDILISLGSVKSNEVDENGLVMCLSHGDFCPWNMLKDGSDIRLIDWEMAANRPLGYDLFMFVIHTRLVMGTDAEDTLELLKKNTDYLRKYFQTFHVSDYQPYLRFFLTIRMEEEQYKGHTQMVNNYCKILSIV